MKFLKRLWAFSVRSGMGKTFYATYFLGCNFPGMTHAYFFWGALMFWLALMLQSMVSKCYRRSPLQDWFDEVNEARKNRIHQERMAARMVAKGHNPITASKAASITIDVLGYADYSLPAA